MILPSSFPSAQAGKPGHQECAPMFRIPAPPPAGRQSTLC